MPIRQPSQCLDQCLIAQALAGLSIGMVLTNTAGKIIWLNRAAENALGMKAPTCIGRPLKELLKDPQMASFWQENRTCGGTAHREVSIRWPQQLDLRVNCTQCTDPAGKPIGRALLFCDVTHERSAGIQLSQAVATRLLELAGSGEESIRPTAGLTTQELRVLRLLARGLGNDDIAHQMSVSPSTVRSHLKSLYRKLNLGSRTEAVAYAVKNQLV
jgi:DNA-binding CsgD family transcriptional regulator